MLKPSRYIVSEKNRNGELLLMSILHCTYVKFPQAYADEVLTLMQSTVINESVGNLKIIDVLKTNKMLIASNLDESLLVDAMHKQHVFSNDWLYLTILPTNNCNFRCIYCYENPAEENMNDQTEKNILDFVRKNIRKYKKLRLNWFGGEPLQQKERVVRMSREINEICKANKIPLVGMMTTNGYDLDLETFRSLISNRILSYQVCIDGSKCTHNVQRPHFQNSDSYQKTYSNLLSIKRNIKSNTFKIVIRANMTPFVEEHLLGHLEDLASDFGNDKRFSIYFQGVRDWGGNRISENAVEIAPDEENYYKKWYDIASEKGLNSADFIPVGPVTGLCEANLKNGYLIYYDGSIHKCSLASQDETSKDIDTVGQIEDGGKMIIDNEKIAKWIVNRVSSENCYNCSLYPICCGGSCPYSKNIKGQKSCLPIKEMIKAHLRCLDYRNMIPTSLRECEENHL